MATVSEYGVTCGASRADFFGHPRGLPYLAGLELWERFSFYGMQTLLVLYLVGHALKPERVSDIWGLGTLVAWRAQSGAFEPVALAAAIAGTYVGMANIGPIIGGFLGDRLFGQRRAVILGALLLAAGHLLMSLEATLLPALAVLICGQSLFKPNIIAQLAALYSPDDPRRTGAFGIYGISINLGGLAAPLVCGTLGETLGWHYGFGAAALGMAFGLALYLSGLRWLPKDNARPKESSSDAQGVAWRPIAAVALALMFYLVALAAYVQLYGLFVLWATDHVDLKIGGWRMPVTWLLTITGGLSILMMAILIRVWKPREVPSGTVRDMRRVATGAAFVALGYAALAASTALFGAETRLPLAFVVIVVMPLLELGFAQLELPMKAFVTRIAPSGVMTTMIGLMSAGLGGAFVVTGWLGSFYVPLGPARFWALHAAIALVAALLLVVLIPTIRKLARD